MVGPRSQTLPMDKASALMTLLGDASAVDQTPTVARLVGMEIAHFQRTARMAEDDGDAGAAHRDRIVVDTLRRIAERLATS
jgi:hypothetical protein